MTTILVVDDRKLNREFLAMLLGYAGYRVTEAADGIEALHQVRQDRPDVVITDIAMPTMDGIEFVQRLRSDALGRQVPVIFYTATYRLNEARNRAQSCGGATVIAKPARPQVILDAVAAALGSVSIPAELAAAAPWRWKRPARALSENLGRVNLRMATLIELGLDLAAERDPQRLLELACGAAEAVFSARVTAIGTRGNGAGRDRYVVRGVADELRPRFGALDLGAVLGDGKAHRYDQAAAAALLPAGLTPLGSLLLVPLTSARRSLGWLCLAGRDGGDAAFSDDDEQIAVTLATQLAQAYENLVLHDQTLVYACQLEAEMAERKLAQFALQASEAHFRAIFDHAPIGIAVLSPAAQFLRVNRALCELVGYTCADLEQRSFDEIIAADEPTVAPALRALADGELPSGDVEMRYRRRDGSSGWMLFGASVLRDEQGEPLQFIAQFMDISERKQAEEGLRLAASVFDSTTDGIIVTDTESRIVSVNPAFTAITGYGADEAVGRKPKLMGSERTTAEFYRAMWDVLLREGHWQGEIWNRRKCGEAFLEWLTINAVPGPDGKPVRYVGVFNDITELRRKEEHIRHLAFHDPLTGLPNRALLRDRLEHGIEVAKREKLRLGLMYIDLDHFKAVNDQLGHEVGDVLLKEVAQRLNQCVRQSDTVARMGGDEFVILLEHAHDLDVYANLARKAAAALAQPVACDGHTLRTGASIGIACFPGDGGDVFGLMRSADAAMYEAKAAGRGTFRFFQPTLGAATAQRVMLDMELRQATTNGELELYYQPRVSIGGDAVFGVEAQLRWRHPKRGLVLPADFIPLAEETGFITELGDWVLEEACRQCSAWHAQGLGRIRIAVTVAAKQLQQDDLATRIASLTARYGIAPADIEVKLTESVILSNREQIHSMVGRLSAVGVSVAVDDYGSGAVSSVNQLRKLPIDSLSIGRSLVADADKKKDAAQLVRSLVALGRALDLTVFAEGIETEGQADFLRSCGCTHGQGYLYGRPAPAADVATWLRAHA